MKRRLLFCVFTLAIVIEAGAVLKEKDLEQTLGILRTELKQYDNIHFFDAPMSKYGVGATEVYFR